MTFEPTELTPEDVDKAIDYLKNHEIKRRECLKCGKTFCPSYSLDMCDECYFLPLPKKDVEKFYRGFFE